MTKLILIVACYILLFSACTAPGQITVTTPQGKTENYPPAIENSTARQQAAQDAWNLFLADFKLPEAKADLQPVLNTPRTIPNEFAGRIALNPGGSEFNELEAKESLKHFIGRARNVLVGDGKTSPLNLKDLSLTTFVNDGNFYRAVYDQVSYGLPVANGYGELRLVVDKNGSLLQWSSTLIPKVSLPVKAEIETKSIAEKFTGRVFTYTSIAGRPMSYKVENASEISIKSLVVYPKLEGEKVTIHLAFPVEVGAGLKWTVYVDAITGQEIDVKQNFAS